MKKDSFKKVRLAAIESNIILRVVKKNLLIFFVFFFKFFLNLAKPEYF